jgi:hypothetical protein
MRRFLVLLAFPIFLSAQYFPPPGGIGAGLSDPTVTAGAGGVTVNLLVGEDTSNPTKYIPLVASGSCGSGVASATVLAGATFTLLNTPGQIYTMVAQGAVTSGHVVLGGTTSPGRVLDSGQTTRAVVDAATCTVGTAQASAADGQTVAVKYDGVGSYGALISAADLPASAMLSSVFLGTRVGLTLSWVDADTISVSAGGCVPSGGVSLAYAGGNVTFAALDTGTRAVGVDYAAFLTGSGIKLTAISTYHAAGLVPSGSTAATSCLIGYLHNGKSQGARNATGDVFQYSITSNGMLDRTHPFRALPDLPAGVPLPGMVRVGSVAFAIYEASHEDASPTAAGSSVYPTSRYGVVPWVSIDGWTTMQVVAQSGLRLPTWAEWLMAVTYNPGSITPASQNGNTNSGASSDDAGQTCTADPTQGGRCLTGTGPRTSSWTGAAAGSSWYSPAGLADAVGNVDEWVATFFGGLRTSAPGGAIAWGYQGDQAYNFMGEAYNPATGGWTEGLPSMLIVGGVWSYGSDAGVRNAYARYSAGNAYDAVGFRPAR